MSRFGATLLLTVTLLAAGCGVFPISGPPTPHGVVTILHTNDFHGSYLPCDSSVALPGYLVNVPGAPVMDLTRPGRVGGYPCLAGKIQQVRRTQGPRSVLLLHAGNAFSDDMLGELTRGEATVRMMNQAGYDFMALGAHDFDYGVPQLSRLQNIADFPMRAANVLNADTDEPILGRPARIFHVNGLLVGVLALGDSNTYKETEAAHIEGVTFSDSRRAAWRGVQTLREWADVVVVLSAQGLEADRALAAAIPGIDLIVSGGSPDWLFQPQRIGRTWIVQAGGNGAALGEVQIVVDNGMVVDVRSQTHLLWEEKCDQPPQALALVRALRAPYARQLDAMVGTADDPIPRCYRAQGPFDRLAGQMLMATTGAQIAMLPAADYGAGLAPGPITREELTSMAPHPYDVVTMTLTGEQVKQVLEQSARNLRPSDPLGLSGGMIQTSGIAWKVDLHALPGQRVSDVTVDNKPIDPHGLYKVVTTSNLAAGLGGYSTFTRGNDVKRTDQTVEQALEAQLRKQQRVSAPDMGMKKVAGQ